MRIPLAILLDRTAGLRLICGDHLAVWQLGREVHPHLAIGGLHAVNELEAADLSPALRVIAAGDGALVASEVVVAGIASSRLVEPEEPGCRLAGFSVVAAGCGDIALSPGAGVGRHAGWQRLATRGHHTGVSDDNRDLAAFILQGAGRRRVGRAGESGECEETNQKRSENSLPIDVVAHDIPPSPQIGVNPDRRATDPGFSKCY